MQKQVDAEGVKLGQERHKVFQPAPKPSTFQAITNVELALGGVAAQRVERRPAIAPLSATDAVISVELGHHRLSGAARGDLGRHGKEPKNVTSGPQ
jgi:hypothetical protein